MIFLSILRYLCHSSFHFGLLSLVALSLCAFEQADAWSNEKVKPNYGSCLLPDQIPSAQLSQSRRRLINSVCSGLGSIVTTPSIASAGEIGAKITRAVTESEIGISVRRSVVRGAQVMDGIDKGWEQFSDSLGLGAARSQREGRPEPKEIPDPKPLDSVIASGLLDLSDKNFAVCSNIPVTQLEKQIEKVAALVQPSFERSGLSKEQMMSKTINSHRQFNYVCYTHFKAYSDLLVERKVDFQSFKKNFEARVGKQIVSLLLPDYPEKSASRQLLDMLQTAVANIDKLSQVLVRTGLVARIDPPVLDPEMVNDWCEDLSDLTWSLALDGDITLGAQILLQEQGFRLYPNFARYAIQYILGSIIGQDVTVEDYYMDTDYNSDPDKFQVKQVLLNIVLEST